jgi:hypothetical protein
VAPARFDFVTEGRVISTSAPSPATRGEWLAAVDLLGAGAGGGSGGTAAVSPSALRCRRRWSHGRPAPPAERSVPAVEGYDVMGLSAGAMEDFLRRHEPDLVAAARARLECETLTSINNLGLLLQAQGRLDEARPLYDEALAGRRAALGDAHPDTLTSINNLGLLLADAGASRGTAARRGSARGDPIGAR